MRTLLILFLLCSSTQAETVVIMRDVGGVVVDYAARFETYRQSRTQVEIRGTCYSSCTMLLGLETVCVAPDAWLGFHKVKGPQGVSDDMLRPYNDFVWSHYPAALQIKLGQLSDKLVKLRGGQIPIRQCQ